MNKWVFGAAGAMALAAGSWLAACSGDDTSGTDAAPDATQGNDAAQGSDTGSDAASDVTDASNPQPDGCVPVDGGLACDPGHIACGAATCDAGAQVCCITDGGAKLTCAPAPPTDGGKPPPNSCTGTKAACDEASDCKAGEVCCGFVGPTGGFSTSCQTSCGTGLQFCHGSAECVTGTCNVQQCRGETIETCSSFCP